MAFGWCIACLLPSPAPQWDDPTRQHDATRRSPAHLERRAIHGTSERNCLKILSTSQPPYHQPCHCRIDERFCGGAQPLVILAHPPVLREPGEGPLHYPSAG